MTYDLIYKLVCPAAQSTPFYDLVPLGEDPEESFSLKSTDNLLTQQLLNLSFLWKKPAYLP